jgi:Na+-transporting methylmalonyl-CoA/oxaloacetate decarboxylase gamma subunit
VEILGSGVQLASIGILVVFLALTLVLLVINSLKYADRFLTRKPTPTQAHRKNQTEPQGGLVAEDAISPEVIAVISAAVSVALEKKARIVQIRARSQGDGAWQRQGRATIMASHTVRK